MSDELKELRLLLADIIDGLAATERRLSSLTSSVTAMRLALSEVSPELFETAYAKHYEDAGLQAQRRSDDSDVQLLLALARRLRSQT